MSDVINLPKDHPPILPEKIGILLINLGTPDGTDYWSMRRYLGEFLSDRRVIELTPWLWQPILQGIILTFRPKKSGAAYASIWNKEQDESPLRTTSRAQAQKLAERFENNPDVIVEWSSRYGNPSTASKIKNLVAQGCRRLLLMPLYPQYSATTMATACDQAFRQLMKERWQPALRTLPAYFEHPLYIKALADSIDTHLASLETRPEKLILSYHGLPKEYLMAGDPYHCQCVKTTRLVKEHMGLEDDFIMTTFQSRFGPKEWLQPYTDETVKSLGDQGVKRIALMSPGFSSDCVETLEELCIEVREEFEAHGGQEFSYVPCLNADEAHIDMLETIAKEQLAGWL